MRFTVLLFRSSSDLPCWKGHHCVSHILACCY